MNPPTPFSLSFSLASIKVINCIFFSNLKTLIAFLQNLAPKLVVYDNSCKLQVYALNRDPGFFSGTRFLVDRFHWRNHTGCAPSYSLDLFPHLSSLNSQVTEQVNSGLSKLKTQLSFMTRENFLRHCQLFLFLRNEKLVS